MRRVFHQWLAAARASRHRNLLLKRLEDEKQLTLTVDAWEKWREKFKEEQLRPLVRSIFRVSFVSNLASSGIPIHLSSPQRHPAQCYGSLEGSYQGM